MRGLTSTTVSGLALLTASSALAADLQFVRKAPPAPLGPSWAGTYVGVSVGAVDDHTGLGEVRLASPGFIVNAGGLFAVPGIYGPVAVNRSAMDTSFIGGLQAGHNWQSGRIVYGVEGDLKFMRNKEDISGAHNEVFVGLIPGGDVVRTTTANITIERLWEMSLRGRLGYTWDRLLVYGTAGLAATSLKTDATITFTTVSPGVPLPGSEPVNLTAGSSSNALYVGATVGAGFEYMFTPAITVGAEYRYTDFGKRSLLLATEPAVTFNPAVPVDTPVSLASHQLTARLNYRLGSPVGDAMASAGPVPAAHNWSGCYVGGHLGAAWGRGPVDTFDPSTSTGVGVFGPGFPNQSPFYDLAGAGTSASYSYDLGAAATGGASAGCNWRAPVPSLVWGVEAEGGFLRLNASTVTPFANADGRNDVVDRTTVGDWYAAITGRVGLPVDQVLFYAKGGVGFTTIKASTTDTCTTGLNCNAQTLNATGEKTPAFLMIGGGAEWAWNNKWSVKAEYLYLGVHETVTACGPGGGGLFIPGLTFCSDHNLGGIHTAKVGANYKLY
jgi:outer membrane immunogenic protein